MSYIGPLRLRPRRARVGAGIMTVALLLLVGCSDGPGADPDPPYVTDGLAAATMSVAPGQPVDIGVPIAIRAGSVTLESATLIQLSGYPLPALVDVGVVPSKGWLAATYDWPPHNAPTGDKTVGVGTLPVQPLDGYVLTAGHPLSLYYSFRGDKGAGTYYVGGIRLTYRRGSEDHTVALYQVGVDCAISGFPAVNHQCNISTTANAVIAKLPQ